MGREGRLAESYMFTLETSSSTPLKLQIRVGVLLNRKAQCHLFVTITLSRGHPRGSLDQSAPFAEVKRNAHVNARAQAANDASDFSEHIRTRAAEATPSH